MAALKTLVFLLAAVVPIALARISEQESLNFLRDANSFDPENLNDPEGFYAPEEFDLPNGDHQLIYSGPEGREACVICQRASPEDDDTADQIRQLKKAISKLRQPVDDDDDDLPKTREPRRGGKKVRPDREPAPEDIPDAPEDDGQPPAPVEDQPAPITLDQAPAQPDQPAPEGQAPAAPDQPAPEGQAPTPEEQAPAPEPLLPEEQPAQIAKALDDLAPTNPADNATVNKVKDILNQTIEEPKTSEEAQKRADNLKVAQENLEKLAAKETDPEKKANITRSIKHVKSCIRKTAEPEPLLPEEQPAQIAKDIDDLAPTDPADKDAFNQVKDVLNMTSEEPKTPEEVKKREDDLNAAEQNLEKLAEKETDPAKKLKITTLIRRIRRYITKTVVRRVKTRTHKRLRTKATKSGSGSRDLKKSRSFSKIRNHKAGSGSRDFHKSRNSTRTRTHKIGGSGSRDKSNNGVRARKAGSGKKDVTKTRIHKIGGSGSRDKSNNGVRARKAGSGKKDVTQKGGSGSRDGIKRRTQRAESGKKDVTKRRTQRAGSGSNDVTKTRTQRAGSGSNDVTKTRTQRDGSGSNDVTKTRTQRAGSGSNDVTKTRTQKAGSGKKNISKSAKSTQTATKSGAGSAGKTRTSSRTSSGGQSEETYTTTEVEETVEYETREEYVK